jgi:hypothetical protein
MQVLNTIKSVTPLELSLIIIFILYIVFPFHTPSSLAGAVDSPLGMIVVFCVTLYLFMYTNPILGVLYIFVAYELFRRSSEVTARTAIIQYTPSQAKMDSEMQAMNPPQHKTLEEEMVEIRAPIGRNQIAPYVDSSFKPVADRVDGASMV